MARKPLEVLEAVARDRFYTELLTAEEFLKMYQDDRDNIESSRPVPAPLGSRWPEFGYILVTRKRPRYPRLPPRLCR